MCRLVVGCGRAFIDFAAAPVICCDISALVRLWNGSMTSVNPAEVNKLHSCFSIRAAREGACLIRCSCASFRMFPVEVVGAGTPEGRAELSGGYATTADSCGSARGALVAVGDAARREDTLRVVADAEGRAMRRALLGVGEEEELRALDSLVVDFLAGLLTP